MPNKLVGALGKFFEGQANNMFTSIPAVVVGVKSLGEKRLDVQPMVDIRTPDGATEKGLPPILNVPLQMPCTASGGLTYPIEVGDSVLLVFSSRGIDTWKRGDGSLSAPSTLRTFDIQDAVAIAGVHPFIQSPNSPSKRSQSHSTDDVVLVHNIGSGRETEVRLLKSGGVVVNTNQDVEVNCTKAEVNSDDFTVNSDNVSFNSGSFSISSGIVDIGTGGYSLVAGEGGATSSGTMRYSGSFILNGTPVENHSHGGVQSGGSRTEPFGG